MSKKNVIEAEFREVRAKPGLAKKTVFNLLSKLTQNLDWILECYQEMQQLETELSMARVKGSIITLPPRWSYEVDEDMVECLQRCADLRKKLDPETWYDEDDEGDPVLKHDIIQKRLFATLTAIPQTKNVEEEVAFHQILMHVTDVPGLNYLMLEGACRELEDVCEWTPPISKVMSVVREHKLWKKRLQAQASIQRLSKDIAGLVAELGPKIEAAKVEAEVKRLEATLRRQRDRLIARQDENAQLTAALQYERRDYERTEASLEGAIADLRKVPYDDAIHQIDEGDTDPLRWAMARVRARLGSNS